MKKIALIILLAIGIAACSKKTVPAASSPASAETKKESVTDSPKIDAEQAELVLNGRKVYTTKCTRCHEAKPVDKWDTTRWTGILKSMIPRSKLTEEESKQVTAYVMANAKKS